MRALKWFLTTLVVLFIVAPLVVVAVVSINENRYMDFPPQGFSLHWYAELWNDIGWRDAITTSLIGGRPLHRRASPGSPRGPPDGERHRRALR